MLNTVANPLPDGFIDELLDQLRDSTRFHLIVHLFYAPRSNDHNCHHTPRSKRVGDSDTTSEPAEDALHKQLLLSTKRLQGLILSNITRVGARFFSQTGHGLYHLLFLCRLITQGHLCNLVELEMHLELGAIHKCPILESHEDDDVGGDNSQDGIKTSLLDKLWFRLQSILSHLPRLRSVKLPEISCSDGHYSLLSSSADLIPAGQPSHLEKLTFSPIKFRAQLKAAHFKYLALHSNYTFPSLTNLDVSGVNFNQTVAVSNDRSTMYDLVQWIEKSMPKLSHLDLSECNLTTTDIATNLANSPILSRLESLNLGGNSSVAVEGWKTLFTSPQFTTNSQGQDNREYPRKLHSHNAKLKTLKLDCNPNIKSLVPLLTQNCPYLTNLTTLSLNHCDLDESSVQSICDSKWIRGLESLSLGDNYRMVSDAVRMIADCEGMRNLTSLHWGRRSGQFSLDFLRYITQSQYLSKLTSLNISGIAYTDSLDQLLLDFFYSPKASALTQLSLTCTNIPPSTMKSIFLSPMLSNLEFVDVSGSYWDRVEGGNEWLEAFVSSPNCRQLQTLFLCWRDVTDSAVLAVSRSPYLSKLRILNLSYNHALTAESVKYLVQSEVVRLKKLSLNQNPLLTPLIFHYLAESPRILSRLEELLISDCPLIENGHHEILAKAGWFDGEITTD